MLLLGVAVIGGGDIGSQNKRWMRSKAGILGESTICTIGFIPKASCTGEPLAYVLAWPLSCLGLALLVNSHA